MAIKLFGVSSLLALSQDQHRFLLEFPQDYGWDTLFFRRTFETGTADVIKKITKSTDTVIDIGANIGWYTILFSSLLTDGSCHAFEPSPNIYTKLLKNCSLNGLGTNIVFNQAALGASDGKVELHTFSHLGHGHSSLSTLGHADYTTVTADMLTLDQYIQQHNLSNVDIIKMDVEGAEMEVLKGAHLLLSMKNPPIWIIEMNKETASSFGHTPSDLLALLQTYTQYKFFRIVSAWKNILPMSSIEDYRHGDNVICVPISRMERFSPLTSSL